MTGAAPSLLSSRVICHHDHLVVAMLATCRAFGLPRCFCSLGKLFPLCPEASAGCDCRRAAAAVADLVFQRCYCSLGKLSPSLPPLLEVNARRCGGFPGCRPLSCVGGPFDIAMVVNKPTAGKGDHLKQRKRKPFGKSGHCVLQTRPPGVKSGQYLPPVLS